MYIIDLYIIYMYNPLYLYIYPTIKKEGNPAIYIINDLRGHMLSK